MRDKMSLIGGTLLHASRRDRLDVAVHRRPAPVCDRLPARRGQGGHLRARPQRQAAFHPERRYFDKRILTMDTPGTRAFPSPEKKNVLVDHFVGGASSTRACTTSRWSATRRGRTRLTQTVCQRRSARGVRLPYRARRRLRRARPHHGADARARDCDARTIGVQIVDVRLKLGRPANEVRSRSIVGREAERKRVANELRSLGAAEAERIRADADRQREVIIAEAYRSAGGQRVRATRP